MRKDRQKIDENEETDVAIIIHVVITKGYLAAAYKKHGCFVQRCA